MKKRACRKYCLSLIALAVFSAVSGLSWAGKPVVTNINVKSIIYDANASGTMLLRSDDYRAIDQALYSASDPKVSSVIALNGGVWQLYLGNQSIRTVYLTLSHPVPGSPAAPVPDGYYYANTEVYAMCYDINNNQTGLLSIPPGMSNNRCSLGVDFSYGRTKYKFVMSPTQVGTGWATVSCNSGDNTGACNSWTIIPNLNSPNPMAANLYEYTAKGLNPNPIGTYYNWFQMDVVR